MSNYNQEPDPDDELEGYRETGYTGSYSGSPIENTPYRGNPIYDPQIERDYRKYYFQSRLDRMREDIEEIYGNRYDRKIEDLCQKKKP